MGIRQVFRQKLRRGKAALREHGSAIWYGGFMPLWRAQARHSRNRLCQHYIAIAGSCGKSTATMVLGRLLQPQASTAYGYFSNDLRHVYRHIRKLDHKVDYFVQEVSEHPLGITAEIGRVLHPDSVLVTAVGRDHYTAFRDESEAATEIGNLVAALAPGAVACLNADDPNVRDMAARCRGRVVLYGRSVDAEVRAENVEATLPEGLRFDLVTAGVRRRVTTRFVGTLMLASVLGPLALVHALGLDLDQAIADLAGVEPHPRRMRVDKGDDGHTYLNDAHKAPLWSTQLLIEDIPRMTSGRRILVLGEISDMGSDGSRKYRRLMRAGAANCDMVIGLGKAASSAERVRRNDKLLNVWPARDLFEVAAMLAAQPPSLVVLKGNKMLRHLSKSELGAIPTLVSA